MEIDDIVNEILPPRAGISQDEAIKRFIDLDNQIKSLARERDDYKSFLIQNAGEQRNGQQTVHLEASNGYRVKVEFRHGPQVDHLMLDEVREILGGERFQGLFKTEYTPKSRNLKSFLNTRFSDERVSTAQEIIKEAVKEVEKFPYVSCERGPSSGGV